MKKVKIELLPIRDNDLVNGVVVLERKKGDKWERFEKIEMTSGTPGASRELLLEDDERIVIEAEQTTTVIYNKEQNAAVPVPSDPKKRAEHYDREEWVRVGNIRREEKLAAMSDKERAEFLAEEATPKKPHFVGQTPPVHTNEVKTKAPLPTAAMPSSEKEIGR